MPTHPAASLHFDTRVIEHGAFPRVRVVLQDGNGPCPLIALANCLALRGEIAVVPSRADGSVACSELMQVLAVYAMARIDARRQAGSGAGAAEHADIATADVLECLPRLVDGLDINVRFTAPDAYEATREHTVFDALGVRLLHGWIADSSADGAMAELLRRHSYNTLIEALIQSAVPPPPPDTQPGTDDNGAEPPQEGHRCVTGAEEEAGVAPTPAHEVTVSEEGAHEEAPAADTEGDQHPAASNTDTADDSSSRAAADDGRRLVEEHGDAARDWLEATSGQLSFSGLLALQQALHNGELAVLFRGGHYSVVGKVPDEPGIPAADRGRLVLLITDVAMATSPSAVWETLEDCDGSGSRFLPRFPAAAVPSGVRTSALEGVTGPRYHHQPPQPAAAARAPPQPQHRAVVQAVAVAGGEEPTRHVVPVGTVVNAQPVGVNPPRHRQQPDAGGGVAHHRYTAAPPKPKSKDGDCIVA